MTDLLNSHEVLIGEYEELERRYDHQREVLTRVRSDNEELRTQLRLALAEIDELQDILQRSYLK